jgi:hypothetical protein
VFSLRRIHRAVTYQMPIKQTLTRAERNRRVMNGIPLDAPRSERRKESDRKPMLDLDAMDAEAELEIARKAQIEAKEKARLEHQKLEASAPAPKPGKAKPPKT